MLNLEVFAESEFTVIKLIVLIKLHVLIKYLATRLISPLLNPC